MKLYGLIGKTLSHSASREYFTNKFYKENIKDSVYELFEIPDISQLAKLLSNSSIKGLNVTIPYKESVINYMHRLSAEAKEIGAVNTIDCKSKKLIGYNTDAIGFLKTLQEDFRCYDSIKALILGTGGAAKAVAYALKKLNIPFLFVSRIKKASNCINYRDIDKEIMISHKLIVNCTPIGMYPYLDSAPRLPYNYITKNHTFYDLIYNPAKTLFLRYAEEKDAKTINGYNMLVYQAEASWKIWQS